MRVVKKLLVTALLLAVAAGGALGGWEIYRRVKEGDKKGVRGRRGGPVPVELSPVTRGPIRDLGLFTGTLEPRSQFLLAPKITGRLEKLLVNVGDPVRPGQLIATLEDEEFAQQAAEAQAELKVARANVENCRSDLEVAQREYERARALREKKVASESELDAAEAHWRTCQAKQKVAEATVTQREAALKAAQVRLAYAKVAAVWEDGNDTRVVGERFVHEGTMLKANEPIVSVLDNRVLLGIINVIERDYPKVHVGQTVTVATDAWPGREFVGRIARIAPMLKESSRQARVEVEIPNAEGLLKPGMFIRARIEFDRRPNATLIPATALARRSAGEGVFLADAAGRSVRFVTVTTGLAEGEHLEVVKPADLAGMVVTLGQHLLEDGSPILVSGRPTSAPASAPARVPKRAAKNTPPAAAGGR